MALTPALAGEDYCYLTTTGRSTGHPHTIEIWFALNNDRLYLLAGGGHAADWVKNVIRKQEVSVRINGIEQKARARVIENGEEDTLARQLLFDKYAPRYSGDLNDWRRAALPVAIDLLAEA